MVVRNCYKMHDTVYTQCSAVQYSISTPESDYPKNSPTCKVPRLISSMHTPMYPLMAAAKAQKTKLAGSAAVRNSLVDWAVDRVPKGRR
eukprot:COSAG02_NODE_4240_length_5597_cov_2.526009_3_plen_89_part_00